LQPSCTLESIRSKVFEARITRELPARMALVAQSTCIWGENRTARLAFACSCYDLTRHTTRFMTFSIWAYTSDRVRVSSGDCLYVSSSDVSANVSFYFFHAACQLRTHHLGVPAHAMLRFSTAHRLWCVDTALIPLEALVVYVKELRKWAVAASQEEQCLAYAVVYNEVPQLLQLVMKMKKTADHSSGEGQLQSLHWTTFAHYDRDTMVWTYECPHSSEPILSLPQMEVRVQSEKDLANELCSFLQLDPPVLLVWPSQPGGARLAYHIEHEQRRDRLPTPLQSSKLPFEQVAETYVSVIPSPLSELSGAPTGCTSSSHQRPREPSLQCSPRKPSRSIHSSDESCRSRSRSPPSRRAMHSGSETESCGHCSLDICCSLAETMIGSPEIQPSN